MMDVEYINLGERTVRRNLKLFPLDLTSMLRKIVLNHLSINLLNMSQVEFEYIRGNWHNLNGEKPLKKVIVESSHDIRKAKDMFK